MKTLVIIGLNHPEPATTAAGTRMVQLMEMFREWGFQIHFLCTTPPSERSIDLSELGVKTRMIRLNHHSFDALIRQMEPDLVIFDRFITEEQFGWRVAEQCPDTLRILDTEDLHFLRKSREDAVLKGLAPADVNHLSEATLRELASIYRCDLSLIISETEIELLQHQLKIDEDLLHYLPFFFDLKEDDPASVTMTYEQRKGFITMGNFKHSPNVDSVIYLKEQVWPHIRKEIPDAKLSIYGAYASEKIMRLHDEDEGFLIRGWTESVQKVMQKARVCLSPLRFGAGLKGKIFDAMLNGTPCVTTRIGAEGIPGKMEFCGSISDDPKEIALSAVRLHNNKDIWTVAQQNGFDILRERFQKSAYTNDLFKRINQINDRINDHRKKNIIGMMLQHHTMKSTKYLSKWIEEKNS